MIHQPSGPFDPLTDLTDLVLWYDISDTDTLTLSGSDIQQVDDKSATGNPLVDAATGSPTLSTINTVQAAALNGMNQGFVTNAVINLQYRTYIMVVQRLSNQAGYRDFAIHNGVPYAEFTYFNTTPEIRSYTGAFNSHVTTLDLNPHVLVCKMSATDTRVWVDGTLATVGANVIGSAINQTISFGYFAAGGALHHHLKIGEIFVTSSGIADAERIACQSYLGTKWGITIS